MTTTVQRPDYGRSMEKLQFTPEEANAFKACMNNSSVIMPTVVTAAIGYGIFRVTPFRAQAKYAALIGGTLGMLSSRIIMSQLCLGKVASMPNSNLRERLAEAGLYKDNRHMSKRLQYQGFQPLDVQSEIASSEEPSIPIIFDDYPSVNAYDTHSGLNDNDFHPSEDTDLSEPLNMQKNTTTSYDELRHKNREEFYKKNKQWYAPRTSERPPAANETTRQAPITSASSQGKNKYGDVFD